MAEFSLYNYHATIIRVIDGDTIDLDIDLGLHIRVRKRVRLYGVDTPEVYGVGRSATGVAAKNYMITALPTGTRVRVKTHLDDSDKYGRLLVEMWKFDGAETVSLSEQLVGMGLGRKVDGKGK